MTTYLAPATTKPSQFGLATRSIGLWTNRLVAAAAIAQFYTAGLAIFGVSSFAAHQGGGWLAQVLSLLTTIALLLARVPFRITQFAILMFILTILQPVLAFGVRQNFPELSALHPVNGIAILAVSILLERRLRTRR